VVGVHASTVSLMDVIRHSAGNGHGTLSCNLRTNDGRDPREDKSKDEERGVAYSCTARRGDTEPFLV
jgi:hypothetical protein